MEETPRFGTDLKLGIIIISLISVFFFSNATGFSSDYIVGLIVGILLAIALLTVVGWKVL